MVAYSRARRFLNSLVLASCQKSRDVFQRRAHAPDTRPLGPSVPQRAHEAQGFDHHWTLACIQLSRLLSELAVNRGRRVRRIHNIAQGLLGARRHLHVFVVAGEPSGDALGAALMTALRAQIRQGNSHRNCIIKDCVVDEGLSAKESKTKECVREEGRQEVRFSGVGGPLMRAAGLQEVFGMEDLAVMGLWELIPHILRLYVRLQQARRAILHSRPDIGDTN